MNNRVYNQDARCSGMGNYHVCRKDVPASQKWRWNHVCLSSSGVCLLWQSDRRHGVLCMLTRTVHSWQQRVLVDVWWRSTPQIVSTRQPYLSDGSLRQSGPACLGDVWSGREMVRILFTVLGGRHAGSPLDLLPSWPIQSHLNVVREPTPVGKRPPFEFPSIFPVFQCECKKSSFSVRRRTGFSAILLFEILNFEFSEA